MTIYAVGDLHGNLPEFRRALRLISADGGARDAVVWLGDYVDRGRDSRAVIDGLVAGRDAGRRWHFILGNHDRLFREFLCDGRINDAAIRSGACWFNHNMGGLTTLASYGLTADEPPGLLRDADGPERLGRFVLNGDALDTQALAARTRAAVPEAHRAFLDGLAVSFETEDLFFAHAGVRPGVPLSEQVEEDLVWIRQAFLQDKSDHGKLVVHGHTPVETPMHMGNRVALDTGAGYGRSATVAAFEGRDVFILGDAGRSALRPA